MNLSQDTHKEAYHERRAHPNPSAGVRGGAQGGKATGAIYGRLGQRGIMSRESKITITFCILAVVYFVSRWIVG